MRDKHKFIVAALSLLALLVAAVTVMPTLEAAPKPPKPKKSVTWSENPLVATVCPGETYSTTVGFTTGTDLTDVSLSLTPSLQDTTTINPTTFAAVVAGVANDVEITFIAPDDSDRTSYNGTLKVRANGNGYKKPLKLRFDVSEDCSTPAPTPVPTNTPIP